MLLNVLMFCSFFLWIFILGHAGPGQTINWSLVNVDLSPIAHVFVSDVLPCAISYICTFAAIHMNGRVGVLDCENVDEIFVVKRKGGEIRTQLQQDIYELNKEDPDRIPYTLNEDNEIRASMYPNEEHENESDKNSDEESDLDDPDRILDLN